MSSIATATDRAAGAQTRKCVPPPDWGSAPTGSLR